MNAPAQGSAEWLAERAGSCTASRAADVLAKIKIGEAATRKKYRLQLVTERLTGIPVNGYQNASMLRGIEMEPFAREQYEAETGMLVEQVGFIKHPEVQWCGASPDGCVGADGLLELKCPESMTHVEWLQDGRVPPEHVPQIAFQLWVTGRQWCDFASYDDRMPEKLRLFVCRWKRDEDYIAKLAAEVNAFLAETEKLYQQILRSA